MYRTNFLSIFIGIVTVVQATLLNEPIETKPRILGGQEASPGEFPFMAYLECEQSLTRTACGGSIIHPQWILTAAHCVIDADACTVEAGMHKLEGLELDTQYIMVKSFYPHKRYYRGAAYDIALLKLENELELNNKVRTIALPVPRSRPKAGEKLTVAGWGLIQADLDYLRLRPINKKYPDVLQKIDVFPLDLHSCRRKVKGSGMSYPHRHNMCATGKSLCWGDSGGPLFSQDRQLIGVVIQSHPTCRAADYPDLYVRVSAFNDWIKNHIEHNNASSYKPYLLHLLIPLQMCSLLMIPHYLLISTGYSALNL